MIDMRMNYWKLGHDCRQLNLTLNRRRQRGRGTDRDECIHSAVTSLMSTTDATRGGVNSVK